MTEKLQEALCRWYVSYLPPTHPSTSHRQKKKKPKQTMRRHAGTAGAVQWYNGPSSITKTNTTTIRIRNALQQQTGGGHDTVPTTATTDGGRHTMLEAARRTVQTQPHTRAQDRGIDDVMRLPRGAWESDWGSKRGAWGVERHHAMCVCAEKREKEKKNLPPQCQDNCENGQPRSDEANNDGNGVPLARVVVGSRMRHLGGCLSSAGGTGGALCAQHQGAVNTRRGKWSR